MNGLYIYYCNLTLNLLGEPSYRGRAENGNLSNFAYASMSFLSFSLFMTFTYFAPTDFKFAARFSASLFIRE